MIEQAIRNYWGEEIYELRKERITEYYYKMRLLVSEHIKDRHEGKTAKKRIEFSEFIAILDSSTLIPETKEQRLIDIKDLLQSERELFCINRCKVKSDNNCNECQLGDIVGNILNLSLSDFEKVLRIMALHKSGDLKKGSTQLIDSPSLNGTLFGGVSEIKEQCEFTDSKILYEKQNKYMLITSIFTDDYMNNEIINNLVNPEAKEICMRILDNKKSDTCLMEIDKLLTANMDVEDIIEEACKINEIDNQEDKIKIESSQPLFMNITKCKKVSLISLTKAKKEYGGRVK